MDDGIAGATNPEGKSALVVNLEACGRRDLDEREAVAARLRGDEDAVRAMIRRGIELKQSKLGLKAALERP
jgi:hypothetical protein